MLLYEPAFATFFCTVYALYLLASRSLTKKSTSRTESFQSALIGNLDTLLSPVGPHLIPLLHLALPIGVFFVVFEKITYLVDT